MSLYSRFAASANGSRALSAARLRYQVLKLLHQAIKQADFPQATLAQRLGVRRSAVNQVFRGDGNVRIKTLAEYLHEMGKELELKMVPVGTQRQAALRDMGHSWHQGGSARANIVARTGVNRGIDNVQWHEAGSDSSKIALVSVG